MGQAVRAGIGRGLQVRDGAGRGGRGAVGQACAGSRRAAAAQSGAGQHGVEVKQKREAGRVSEEVRAEAGGGCRSARD